MDKGEIYDYLVNDLCCWAKRVAEKATNPKVKEWASSFSIDEAEIVVQLEAFVDWDDIPDNLSKTQLRNEAYQLRNVVCRASNLSVFFSKF